MHQVIKPRFRYSSVKSRYKNTAEKKVGADTETVFKLNLTNASSSGSSCSKETPIAPRQIEDDIETMIDLNDACSPPNHEDEQPVCTYHVCTQIALCDRCLIVCCRILLTKHLERQ